MPPKAVYDLDASFELSAGALCTCVTLSRWRLSGEIEMGQVDATVAKAKAKLFNVHIPSSALGLSDGLAFIE